VKAQSHSDSIFKDSLINSIFSCRRVFNPDEFATEVAPTKFTFSRERYKEGF